VVCGSKTICRVRHRNVARADGIKGLKLLRIIKPKVNARLICQVTSGYIGFHIATVAGLHIATADCNEK